MCEPTIDIKDTCCVCGSLIWSTESVQRGYGSECADAIHEAIRMRIFSDADLKKKYYEIEAKAIISLIAQKTFRSAFKKSFQSSIINQGTWLSKKQKEICYSFLSFEEQNELHNKIHAEHIEFWKSIKITREDIEIARQIKRKEK